MKTKAILIVSIVAMLSFSALAQTNPVAGPTDNTAIIATNVVSDPVASTNAPPVPAQAPETLKPLLELLGGKGTWITTLIAWFAALSLALAPFAVWIRNKLADAINSAAETSGEDDDSYLRSLFSNPLYRLLTFVLNFANIRFPTLAELERAIELQREAVKKALPTPTPINL